VQGGAGAGDNDDVDDDGPFSERAKKEEWHDSDEPSVTRNDETDESSAESSLITRRLSQLYGLFSGSSQELPTGNSATSEASGSTLAEDEVRNTDCF
jgi:hypothetical protein